MVCILIGNAHFVTGKLQLGQLGFVVVLFCFFPPTIVTLYIFEEPKTGAVVGPLNKHTATVFESGRDGIGKLSDQLSHSSHILFLF